MPSPQHGLFIPFFLVNLRCCSDKHLKVTEDVIEISEDRSLTGKNSKLNEAYGKVLTEKQMEESGGLSSLSQKNPLFSAAPSGTSGRGL